MTYEESQRYALQVTIRQSTRNTWDKKLGRALYSVTRYDHLIIVAIPLTDGYLMLLSCDVKTKDVDSLLMNKLIPKLKLTIRRMQTMLAKTFTLPDALFFHDALLHLQHPYCYNGLL